MAVSIYNPVGGSGNRNGGKGLPGQYGDYNKVQAIAKKNEIIAPVKKNIQPVAPKPETKYVYVNNSTPAPAPSYSGGTDDVLNQIKSLLSQQQKAAEEAYKTMYEQQLAQNKQAWESNRNQINRNYKRTDRYINSMYGDAISGSGLSNRTRNYTNWNNNLASNQQNYTNNDASALSQFNQNKAGAYSTLANGWYNYVLPIYTNRQRNLDDYDYRRYLATL